MALGRGGHEGKANRAGTRQAGERRGNRSVLGTNVEELDFEALIVIKIAEYFLCLHKPRSGVIKGSDSLNCRRGRAWEVLGWVWSDSPKTSSGSLA